MSEPFYTDADIKQWRPELIELTQISNPVINNGIPTKCFVDPSLITIVMRNQTVWNEPDGSKSEPIECTNVYIMPSGNVCVTELPEEINKLRNKAYGVLGESLLKSV